jgi:hypothetical protein
VKNAPAASTISALEKEQNMNVSGLLFVVVFFNAPLCVGLFVFEKQGVVPGILAGIVMFALEIVLCSRQDRHLRERWMQESK